MRRHLIAHPSKPCRGCGGDKGDAGERAHFCDSCAKDPFSRPLLLKGKCRNGHLFSEAGITMEGSRWRCTLCLSERNAANWADDEKKVRIRLATRRSALKRKYGLSLEQWFSMFDNQGGRCQICKAPLKRDPEGDGKLAAVDHNHATGEVRGLLCVRPCNYRLGLFYDDPELLRSSADYLENSGIGVYVPSKKRRKRKSK